MSRDPLQDGGRVGVPARIPGRIILGRRGRIRTSDLLRVKQAL